ncbi:hypothetical protein BX070DRAFT_262353 [Coemansia spiralis]|nr:hypothetical protein BX070DRAFT_262353 [Coemansia spiralis]
MANTELFGRFSALIVGRRYYFSRILPNELVLLVREHHNRHDTNAIAVHTMQDNMLGHLPRWLAAVLAPCMDSAQCRLEGIVVGPGSRYATPVEIKIYAPVSEATWLKNLLGTYWEMWQLEPPKKHTNIGSTNNVISAGYFELESKPDNAHNQRLHMEEHPYSVLYAQSQNTHKDEIMISSTEKGTILVISTESGIADWIQCIAESADNNGACKINWSIYSHEMSVDSLCHLDAVFACHRNVDYVLSHTKLLHWKTVVVDQTAIGDLPVLLVPWLAIIERGPSTLIRI